MNAVDTVLADAEKLVERGWCRGMMARERHGDECHPASPNATHFCVEGAIVRAANGNRTKERLALHHMAKVVCDWPADWNDMDGRTRDEVVEALRQARESW